MTSYLALSEHNRAELQEISEHFTKGYKECCTGWNRLCRLVEEISKTVVPQSTAEKIGQLFRGLGWTALVLLTPMPCSLTVLGARTIVGLWWGPFSNESQAHMYTGLATACGLIALSHAAQSIIHPLYVLSAGVYGVASWWLFTRAGNS